ncbi:MAG: class I SAM-dependent methyltransferase [Chloroflexi bacterium]|nr:class I SAM-dependent methyltransferase [Chloroflexota bacterium]
MDRDITVSDLDIMNGAVNYRRWLFSQVSSFVGRRVFEIGSGIGNYTEFLLDRELVVCLEIHAAAAARLRARFADQPGIRIYDGDIADPRLRRLAEHRCDTAICFNVLEHVADDVGALENIAAILVPGGRVLLIVPAVPAIMGTVDESLGHYRRYTPRTLRAVFRAANYQVESLRYMNLPGILGWWLNNRVLHRVEESAHQIRFYDRAIVPWVAAVERVLPPQIGLSLVCIASRQVH